jgi:aryl-alcohol dehydrogenase-like predicted oxidoreductase
MYQDGLLEREGIDSAKNILKIARDGGINLFDNAETYGTFDVRGKIVLKLPSPA